MTVENRADKQLTDKAQAAEAQSWASNLHQVRLSAHRGGGGGAAAAVLGSPPFHSVSHVPL